MTISTIPVQATTDAFSQQVELDLVVYDLTFTWNARDKHWSLDIGQDGTVILAGLKLIVSDDLLAYSRRIPELPPGRLFITDLDGQFRDPDDTVFGNRVVLQYEDAA